MQPKNKNKRIKVGKKKKSHQEGEKEINTLAAESEWSKVFFWIAY